MLGMYSCCIGLLRSRTELLRSSEADVVGAVSGVRPPARSVEGSILL